MGYAPIYNLAISAVARLVRRRQLLLYYISDTNGFALAERVAKAMADAVGLLAKRAVLGSVFETSFDLGLSNALAHRLQGIRDGVAIPLLTTDFPASLTVELPERLAAVTDDLPRPRLLALSRLVECKNLVSLVEAFTRASKAGMPGSLTIVGEGPERSLLEPRIARIPDRVRLVGAVPFDASRQIFGAFDGLVIPSTADAWGIVIVEALGWGIPVLSSDRCGAGVSLAIDGADAIRLCEPSIDSIQENLTAFVTNLETHRRSADKIAPMIRRRFGTSEVADALIALVNNRPSESGSQH
jgi:Glycosyl transferases group 1